MEEMLIMWIKGKCVLSVAVTGRCHVISLCCTSQRVRLLQTEGMWKPYVQQACRHHFSTSICSPHVSVPHFGNFRNVPNLFTILLVVVTCDL